MRRIDKLSEPAFFKEWKADNCDDIQSRIDSSSGTDIWDWFGKTFPQVRDKLRSALLKEQGHICCYCGQDIKDGPTAIEHFLPKEKHKSQIFEYSNLMISCKQSELTTHPPIRFLETLGYETLDTIGAICEKAGSSPENFRKHNQIFAGKDPRKTITEVVKGENLYLYIRHCDDKKENVDPSVVADKIINPISEEAIGSNFYFKEDGKIEMPKCHQTIVDNMSEHVLNLHAAHLCTLRSQHYRAAKQLQEVLMQNDSIPEELLILEINSQENSDEFNIKQPFCFVYSQVLKELIT